MAWASYVLWRGQAFALRQTSCTSIGVPVIVDSKSRAGSVSVCLAIANAVVTAGVLATPIGIGSGSGVLGYSVYRMLILICPQSIIALAGFVLAFVAMSKQRSWIPGLILNVLVMIATFFLYFAQSQTIGRFL